MIEGIFGANQNLQINNKTTKAEPSAVAGDGFKNALADLVRSSKMTVTDKGIARETAFSKWSNPEYFNLEEEKEDAAQECLKKLKRVLKQKLGY